MQEIFEKIIGKLENFQQHQVKLLCEHNSHCDDQCAMRGYNELKKSY